MVSFAARALAFAACLLTVAAAFASAAPLRAARATTAAAAAPSDSTNMVVEDGLAVNYAMVNITEDPNHQYSAPWVPFAGAQAQAYEAMSEQLLSGCTDIRAQYGAQYSLASSLALTLRAASGEWYAAAGLDAAACPESTCWEPVARTLGYELALLAQLDTYERMFDDLADVFLADMGSYVAGAANIIELDSQSAMPPPKKWHSWLHTGLSVFSSAAKLAVKVSESSAEEGGDEGTKDSGASVSDFLSIASGVASFAGGHTSGSASTADVDFYMDNQSTMMAVANLELNMPRVFAGMKAVTANQCAVIAGDWGRLQAFRRLVAAAGAIPSKGAMDELYDLLQGQMEFQAFAWVTPSKYMLVVADHWGHTDEKCKDSNVIASGHYHASNGDLGNYYENCSSGGDICSAISKCQNKKLISTCQQTRYAWLGEIARNYYVPADALFDTLNRDCGAYMLQAFGTDDFMTAISQSNMWFVNYVQPNGQGDLDGISLSVTLIQTCKSKNSNGQNRCAATEFNCMGQPITDSTLPPWAPKQQ